MPQQLTRFRVNHHLEEFSCCWCAMPVYLGEHGYEIGDFGEAYCSRRCADKMDAYNNAKKAVRERLSEA